jgi:hypothetical protein
VRKPLFILLFISLTLFITEAALRQFAGFCQAPLYVESPEFEYIYAPNQHVIRFRNTIITNEYSMRSAPLSPADSIRILLIGDSVINGGNPTDHDSLASTLLERQLSIKFNRPVRVLNISAGSWGPDNAAAYLKKHGNFGASMLLLVFSSHDAYDNMTFEKVVDVHPACPSRQASFALIELTERYLIPRAVSYLQHFKKSSSEIGTNELLINKAGQSFNSGFDFFREYAETYQIPLFFLLHAELKELQTGSYAREGNVIIDFLENNKIPYLLSKDQGFTNAMYRDGIHLNNRGQKHLAEVLFPVIDAVVDSKIALN